LYTEVEQTIVSSLVTEETINGYLDKISVAFSRFQSAHLEYCHSLETKPELETEAMSSYDEQLLRKFDVENRLNQLVKEISDKNIPLEFEIRPEDSISRAGSRRNSRSHVSSAASSASSSKIRKVRAKQAVARLKLKQLEHQQELVMKEVEMKMKREMVEVQNEIDQADLEAEIYEQNIEDDEVRRKQIYA
jgi:hypothetical protein